MPRRAPALVTTLLALLAAAAPAAGANRNVAATPGDTFTPRSVAVKPGEKVTFTNQGGEHNVDWEDAFRSLPGPQPSADPWIVERTFTRSAPYRYFCLVHGSRGGFGMSGIVYVNPPGVVPPSIVLPSSLARRGGATIRFTATGASTVAGTILRRLPTGRYAFYGSLSYFAPRGFVSRFVSRTATGRLLTAGSYRLDFRLRVAGSAYSLPRTVLFRVL